MKFISHLRYSWEERYFAVCFRKVLWWQWNLCAYTVKDEWVNKSKKSLMNHTNLEKWCKIKGKASACMCLCVCVSVCVFILHPLLFPYRGARTWVLSSPCKTDWADFIDWMSFLPSNLIEEINHDAEPLSQIPKAFNHQSWKE